MPHAKTGFYSGFAGIGKVERRNYIANWSGVKSKPQRTLPFPATSIGRIKVSAAV